MTSLITYEFPLNERIRIFIRLEQLFHQFKHHLEGQNIIDKRAAMSVLLDLIAIFKRNDLKSEILKELERQAGVLSKIAQNQHDNIDTQKLQELLAQLRDTSQKIYASTGKIGNHLTDNNLFQSIAQRYSIPGGTCSFDLPEFHFWLSQNDEIYQQDLQNWSAPFLEIGDAIDLVLGFIRSSCSINDEIAPAGFFQIALDTNLPNQLLRVSIDSMQPYFAEISGGKHRCTIRFMQPLPNGGRPIQATQDVPFTLMRCVF